MCFFCFFGGVRKENVEIIRVNDLLKAQEVSKEKGWQNSWSNYSLIAFFFFSPTRERICELVIILNLFWRGACGMMGDRVGSLINRMGLVKNNQGLCSWHFQAWLSSLPPITFSFFAIINCNNTQRRWRVGRARRDLMRPKKAGFHCYCCPTVITIRDIFYS